MLLRSRRVGQLALRRAAGLAETVDHTTARLNIEHFHRLLNEEKDEPKRRVIRRLLAEEEAKLDVLDNPAPRDKAG